MHESSGSGSSGLKTSIIDFTAGTIGGAVGVYVSQPLDTVKVKMQTFPHLYNNMGTCMVQTFKKDGLFRGLYAGSVPAVAANVAENSVLFLAYGWCQKLVATTSGRESIKDLSLIENATAGFLAAFFSSFPLCPTELIKCKLQAMRETQEPGKNAKHISPFQLTRQILKAEGVPGLFRGLTSTFAREMPGYFFFFGGYEGCRQFLTKPGQKKEDIGALRTMVSGAVGGMSLWIAIFPADVIKSRIQVQSLKRSMRSVGMEIIRKEGVRALYNGLTPSIFRTIPATSCLFLAYEYSKKFMEKYF